MASIGQKYKQWTIALNAQMKFDVTGPGFDEDGATFESLALAKAGADAIERRMVKKKTLELPAMSWNSAHKFLITGINMHSSDVTTQPNYKRTHDEDEYYESAIYPDIPELVPLLKERLELKKQIAALDKKLEPCRLTRGRGYIRNGEEYVQHLEKLEKDYAGAVEAAKKLTKAKK